MFALFGAGCATEKIEHHNVSAPMRPPGPITVACQEAPATVAFDKAAGQVETAGHRAGNAARNLLMCEVYEPHLVYVEAALRMVAAPISASVGAMSGKHNELSGDRLAQAEAQLRTAMEDAARQKHFRDVVLKVASEKTRRQFVSAESSSEPVGAILETRIEGLRLEKTGSSDSSFALHIQTRARLLRASDHAVLFDQPFEYRSEKALFLDWTLHDGFASVANTGYHELAERMVDRMFTTAAQPPVLLGAGYGKVPHKDLGTPMLAMGMSNLSPLKGERDGSKGLKATLTPALSQREREKLSPVFGTSLNDDKTRFVDFSVPAGPGAIGIYSTTSVAHVTLQRPLSKDEAVSEAIDDVECSLEDLLEFPNPLINLGALAASVPMSLGKQAIGAMRGLTAKQLKKADAHLTAALREARPQEMLAMQVAQQLSPLSAERVALVKKPAIPGAGPEIGLMECVNRGTLAWLPDHQTAAGYLTSQGVDTALEIHVISAALCGKEGVNPGLVLNVEAEASLLRASDGAQLYSCPVHYRSGQHQFTAWGADNAKLFRQELDQCQREMSKTIVDQLVSQGLLPSSQSPSLAKN